MLALVACLMLPQGGEDPKIDFARRVLPILSNHCLQCHGPDERTRKAKLRLDTKSGLERVVTAGRPDRSPLFEKITATHAEDRMPPASTGKPLRAAQIETIRAWIVQGGEFQRHWSFVTPTRPRTPRIESEWAKNDIDRFVLAKLQTTKVRPSGEADRPTLARRVSFALTGLPPTREELAQFLADTKPRAYERLVDRLLASPHYGERMATVWLDAARYADTDGYQADATRHNWPWRDWVVDAYNRNMRFDRFTIEQFAGDLLPKASPEQRLATCFHRNHMANGEGGRHPEESRVDYVLDRVNTVGTVWLGVTMGCAQCHDHKYDPISQRDYYALSAFFDSIDEDGRAGGGAKPFLDYRSTRGQAGREAAEAWLQKQQTALAAAELAAKPEFERWLRERARGIEGHRSWRTFKPSALKATHAATLAVQNDAIEAQGPNAQHEDYTIFIRPALRRITGMRLTVLPGENGKLSLADDGHIILTNLKVSVRTRGKLQVRAVTIRATAADYQNKKRSSKDYGPLRDVLDDDPRTGWSTARSKPTERRIAVFAFEAPIVLAANQDLQIDLHHRSLRGQSNIRRFRIEFTDEAGPAVQRVSATPMEGLAAVRGDLAQLTAAAREDLRREFLADHQAVNRARSARDRARKRRDRWRQATVKDQRVMVLAQRKKPRRTHVLLRGVWNKHGAAVTPNVPAAFGQWPKGQDKDRYGLARYLVDGKHPLTARVAVNRYWQMYFGAGLVRTPEDFGRQGAQPTHPELLDWLACEFVASGWNIKHMQRLIVTSATFRQSSKLDAARRDRDPENRLLARASSFRLPSWVIRDAALQASGLLVPRVGGPPVFPYQPEGVWAASTMGRFHYQRSVGGDLYRRSLYSFWRRMVAPTGMFDASPRRTCQVRVVRTNTPLQALTLLNDVTFVEAARVLAERALAAGGDARARIRHMFERVLSRQPDAHELAKIAGALREARVHFAADRAAARKLARAGDRAPVDGLDAVEVAAYCVVASTLFNLDEAMTQR